MCRERENPKWDQFSWLTVRALFESVNDVLAKRDPELINARRLRWVSAQRSAGYDREQSAGGLNFLDDFVIDHSDEEEAAFFIIGDTGEQDASQYAVYPYLTGWPDEWDAHGRPKPTSFTVIASDVVYPAGDINEYINGFYIPYCDYERPIYAIPGNHDWYDGLNGFMYHFCAAEPLPIERFRTTNLRPSSRLAAFSWRGAEPPQREELSRWRDSRKPPRRVGSPLQPGPYFAINTRDLLIVCIDTGVGGDIDDEQGRWLLRISDRFKKRKILVTGKPIYVDNNYQPGVISWATREVPVAGKGQNERAIRTVDDIVRHPDFGYLAAIGGDVHNYQRYPVWDRDQKRLTHYLVSGGGGAYLSPTHRIPRVGGPPTSSKAHPWPPKRDVAGEVSDDLEMPREPGDAGDERIDNAASEVQDEPSEAQRFRCYPLRADSLAYSARSAGPRLFTAIVAAATSFSAAVWLYTSAKPADETSQLGALAVVITALVVACAVGLRAWRSKRTGEDPRNRTTSLVLTAALGIVVATFAIGLVWSKDVVRDGHFWCVAALTVAVPILFIAGVLLAQDRRGNVPTGTGDLLAGATLIAGILLFFDVDDFDSFPAWLVVGFLALAGLSLFALARRAGYRIALRTPPKASSSQLAVEAPGSTPDWLFATERLLVFLAPPVLLAVALALSFDATWLARFALAVLAAFAIPWALDPGDPTGPCKKRAMWARRLDTAATFAGAVAWAAVALVLLGQIGSGWVAEGIIVGTGLLVIVAVVAIFALMTVFTWLKRVAFGLVLEAAIVASALASWPLGRYSWLVIAAALILYTGLACRTLRNGKLNANDADAYLAEALGTRPLPRREPDTHASDATNIAHVLYPARRAGTQPTLAERGAKLVAELSDADEPPFFKSFLRFDVSKLERRTQCGFDRQLVIRCFGVTGYADGEERPDPSNADEALEDRLEISFESAEALRDAT
jgi:hypothetical protein